MRKLLFLDVTQFFVFYLLTHGDNFRMNVKVTIGVCLRNSENSLGRIINRIVNQDFPHKKMEVLFVDDGSEDNTLSTIFESASKMKIKYTVYTHSWKGLGFSRNVVAKNAKGDYIVWLDDGTIIPTDYIMNQVEFMEKNPDVGIARGIIGVYSGSSFIATLENMSDLVFSHKYGGKLTTKLPGTGGSIYRVKASRQVRGFDEHIHGSNEDADIAFRILSAGWKICITQIVFHIELNKSFERVWAKSFWYGYGLHFIMHKHKELNDFLYKSTPFSGFIEGILTAFTSYKLTGKKLVFLLPFYFFIKRIAWCLGYLKSHVDSYGHIKQTSVSNPK